MEKLKDFLCNWCVRLIVLGYALLALSIPVVLVYGLIEEPSRLFSFTPLIFIGITAKGLSMLDRGSKWALMFIVVGVVGAFLTLAACGGYPSSYLTYRGIFD